VEYVYWILDDPLAGRPGRVEFPWNLNKFYAEWERAGQHA